MTNKDERVFITGGAGFIGSHVVDTLLAQGAHVTAYDNLSTGTMGRIRHNLDCPRFRFHQSDLMDGVALREALAGHDIVWHLAACTDIPNGDRNPEMHIRDGILITHRILEAMRDVGVRRLVFPSSSTIYGETEVMPTPEDLGPLFPRSVYGASKLACEALVSAYAHLFGIQSWIFRFGNVEGARMDHGVVFDFIHKLRKDPHHLEILGDGAQEKNYFLVEECIEAIGFAVAHATDKPVDAFNLGNASTTRVTTIADIVVEEMGLKDVRYRFTGGDRGWPGDVPKVIYDVSKMKRLGWEARHTSTEAVRITTRRLLAKG